MRWMPIIKFNGIPLYTYLIHLIQYTPYHSIYLISLISTVYPLYTLYGIHLITLYLLYLMYQRYTGEVGHSFLTQTVVVLPKPQKACCSKCLTWRHRTRTPCHWYQTSLLRSLARANFYFWTKWNGESWFSTVFSDSMGGWFVFLSMTAQVHQHIINIRHIIL